jgi:AbiV family abortive infection protein
MKSDKRNYHSNLKFIESAFVATSECATELTCAAKILLDNSQNALATSLSILAIEELGKFICIDGLLFSKSGDSKSNNYKESLKGHNIKLDAFFSALFPLLSNFIIDDPRKGNSVFVKQFNAGLIGIEKLTHLLFDLLKSEDWRCLNRLKQSGFYAEAKNNTFIKPNDAVTRDVAENVYLLASSATSILELVIKDNNLERYLNQALSIRAKLSEADFDMLAKQIETMFRERLDGNEESNKVIH